MASVGRDRGRRRLAVALIPALAGLPAAASAQTADEPAPSNPQHRYENGEMLPGRSSAAIWSFTYNSDANADVAGGDRRGAAYLQRLGLIGDFDLGQMLGWSGASAHVSVHAINGTGLSASRTRNALTVSGIEAEPALRLFNLWVEQKMGKRLSLRVGQFTAGQEFAISPTANLFINSTFGWPASFATDLPSGGPAYPLAAPGARLAATLNDRLSVRLAMFAGDPAGPGLGDPQRRDLHGLNGLRFAGSPFIIGEASITSGGTDPAWSLTLGSWTHLGAFDDLRRDDQGRSLASPQSSGVPLSHQGDYTAYIIADGRLWYSGARSLHGFVRASASPSDRNPIDLYVDAGLSIAAPFSGREGDTAGIAIAVARISPSLAKLSDERSAISGTSHKAPHFEAVIEASYQLKFNDRFYLQPNVQFVLHPAAALLSDDTGAAPLPPNALVLGLRTSFRL